jgi:hypothetical protein
MFDPVTGTAPLFGSFGYSTPNDETALAIFVAGRAVVVIPGIPSGAVSSRVWSALTSGATTIESVVEAIPLVGGDAVPSFAVVVLEGSTEGGACDVTAILRGESVIEIYTDAGGRRFTADGVVPWHLAGFSAVRGVGFVQALGTATRPVASSVGGQRMPVGAAPGGHTFPVPYEFPLSAGAVRASRALWSFAAEGTAWSPPSALDAEDGLVAGQLDGDDETTLQSPRLPPPRFRIRIGETSPFLLDDAVLVGRNPRAPIPIGVRPPILVTVPSPSREVSSTHLEIMQRGDHVVVTDLKSTNGTTVTLPGAARIKLRQGDSIVTPPRSRIEIGDGNVIEILPEG